MGKEKTMKSIENYYEQLLNKDKVTKERNLKVVYFEINIEIEKYQGTRKYIEKLEIESIKIKEDLKLMIRT